MSNDNHKTSFSRFVSKRIRRVLLDAAITATATTDHVINTIPSGSEVYLKSDRDEESYLDLVLSEAIKRRNYKTLPRAFDDVERLADLSPQAVIEKEKDYHLQMGIIAMQAAFQCIAGVSPDFVDEELEPVIVRESMATTQFFLGEFYNLREHRRIDLANWMRGIIETAYSKSLDIQGYLGSVVNAVRTGTFDEIEWVPQSPRPQLSPECMTAALKGISATSTMFELFYHLPSTPFELPQISTKFTFVIR